MRCESAYKLVLVSFAAVGCTTTKMVPPGDAHADHASTSASLPAAQGSTALPPDAAGAPGRLSASPRHGEWVMIRTGNGDSLHTWVVYPERSTKAPVVVVVHEIFGLSTWVRGVADQLAADGFIAVAPDLLTGKVAAAPGSDTVAAAAATAAIRSLGSADVQRQIAA